MNSDEIIHVYKTGFKKISKHYHAMDDFEPDTIHHFRVEMKKLRAFVRLTNLAIADRPQKIPKDLKKVYDNAGKIRNIQMHRQRITGLSSDLLILRPALYLQILHDEERSMQKKGKHISEHLSLKESEKKLIEKVPQKITRETEFVFVRQTKLRLEALLTLPFYYDEALHDVRKVIKDLMYNYKYLKTVAAIEIPQSLSEPKTMESLTNALGDFHDLCIALSLLSPVYLDQVTEPQEEEVLKEIKNHLQLRKKDMRDEVINLLIPVKQQIEKERSLIPTQEPM